MSATYVREPRTTPAAAPGETPQPTVAPQPTAMAPALGSLLEDDEDEAFNSHLASLGFAPDAIAAGAAQRLKIRSAAMGAGAAL